MNNSTIDRSTDAKYYFGGEYTDFNGQLYDYKTKQKINSKIMESRRTYRKANETNNRTKEKKYVLTESQLNSLYSNNSIKRRGYTHSSRKYGKHAIFESVLNEGMVLPNRVKKVWWDGNDSFVVLGMNNRWYDVYPNHGDSYMIDCEIDKLIDSYAEKIKKAYRNNRISPSVYTYNLEGKPQIIDDTPTDEFFDQINRWLIGKGFSLKKEREDWYGPVWEYEGEYGDDSGNVEVIKRVSKMIDVTSDVKRFFDNGGNLRNDTIQALRYLKNTK